MKVLMICSFLCFYCPLAAQRIFTEAELVAVVKRFHPIAKQALLDVQIAEANLTASRAPFDPVASLNNGRKDFDGITYYDQQLIELKIPTWYGIDIHAGAETINGSRINPEETKGRINYIGASVPLMQGVLIDKRRAAVMQARVMKESAELGRKAALNDLVAEALLAYWEWWEQHQVLEVIQATVNNARARSTMVKRAHALGDRPAIDT
ncbi:MAG TPA: TolC family protein, partial [Flavisolibacter sp.]|nr:TolC family protein [Flavisolibacter sp.]